MSEIYFLGEESEGKSDLIKTILNKIDVSKQDATIRNNKTSKEVRPFLETCNEELIVYDNLRVEKDSPDRTSDNNESNNNSETEENLKENSGNSNNNDG